MSSGQKRLVFNTRERAISTDNNRQQDFLALGLAETLRALIDTSAGYDDLAAGAVATENSAAASPSVGEVLQGLMVQPLGGTTSVYVSPGTAYIIAPDGDLDSSPYKYVEDLGVVTAGLLVISSNGGPSPRIDIIECQWAEAISEIASRDIYDPSTDTFTASAVTKVIAGQLTYRVRSGTIGGGFASVGTATGWLPLAVVSTPAGSITVDTCTFWDVRPLINDRTFAPFNMNRAYGQEHQASGQVGAHPGASAGYFSGYFERDLNGRRVGGVMRRGTPGFDADYVVLNDPANQAAPLATSEFAYVYLATPFGLPRWARYTDGPVGRVPRSPRGIPVVATFPYGPNADGKISATLPLPASTGLGGSTADAICIAVHVTDASIPGFPGGLVVDGVAQTPEYSTANMIVTDLGSATNTTIDFVLIDQSFAPTNATAVWAVITIPLLVSANSIEYPSDLYLSLYDGVGALIATLQPFSWGPLSNPTAGALTLSWHLAVRIPVVRNLPASVAPTQRNVRVSTAGTWGSVPINPYLTVYAWELNS